MIISPAPGHGGNGGNVGVVVVGDAIRIHHTGSGLRATEDASQSHAHREHLTGR
jgi:hypothetical protein